MGEEGSASASNWEVANYLAAIFRLEVGKELYVGMKKTSTLHLKLVFIQAKGKGR